MNKKEWSVKDLAELCGVSKPTIQTAIKSLELEFDRFDKNKQFFFSEKAKKIAEFVKNDIDFGNIFFDRKDEKAEKSDNDNEMIQEKLSPNFEKQPPKVAKELEEVEKKLEEIAKKQQEEVEFLRQQLKAKDEESKTHLDIIQNLNKDIKTLNEKNENLITSNVLLTQQLKAIEDKQKAEEEKKKADEVIIDDDIKPIETPVKKDNIFIRIAKAIKG